MNGPASAPFIVTLDGPAGVGKSTLAKQLAAALGIACLDTGAMFRALAVHLTTKGWSFKNAATNGTGADPGLQELLEGCVFALCGVGEKTELLCNNIPVGDAIRSEEAGMMASNIALLPQVREYLKTAQRRLGAGSSLVAEGRDMGTLVFPAASCKIFLEAQAEIRAKRRCLQLQNAGIACNLAELAEQIRLRDQQDKNRAIAPLCPAKDAVIIDTSAMSTAEVLAAILQIAETQKQAEPPVYAMRRKDRAISHSESLALLSNCEYGVLATTDKDGRPYAVPLSYVLMDDALYFHCAFAGHKINNIDSDNRVCFTAVGATQPIYNGDFSTCYESVIVRGRAFAVTEEPEKSQSLRKLVEKYLPDHEDKFEESMMRSATHTAVYKIVIEQLSGKAKRIKAK